ncbi:MAG: hypothetical protein AAF677_09605 [Pseudomonadota bacterium]
MYRVFGLLLLCSTLLLSGCFSYDKELSAGWKEIKPTRFFGKGNHVFKSVKSDEYIFLDVYESGMIYRSESMDPRKKAASPVQVLTIYSHQRLPTGHYMAETVLDGTPLFTMVSYQKTDTTKGLSLIVKIGEPTNEREIFALYRDIKPSEIRRFEMLTGRARDAAIRRKRLVDDARS